MSLNQYFQKEREYQAVSELYGQTISPDIIQFQKTKKEFEGDITPGGFSICKTGPQIARTNG